MADFLARYFHWSDIPGHISYVIMAVSYLLTNIFWLRVAAVVSMLFEIVYFLLIGSVPWASIFWDGAFIFINTVQVGYLVRDRLSLKLHPDQLAFIKPIVGDLDKAQIAQLLRTGEWRTLAEGTVLTVENLPVHDLTFICEGQTEVRVRDQVVAHVGAGSFIGDVSFTTGVPASATVAVDQVVRVIAFNQVRLKALCAKDEQIASALYRRIGGGLADKMRATTSRL